MLSRQKATAKAARKMRESGVDDSQSTPVCSGKNCYNKRYSSVFKETDQSKIAVLSELQNRIFQFDQDRITETDSV